MELRLSHSRKLPFLRWSQPRRLLCRESCR
jgi:hypothetical protein